MKAEAATVTVSDTQMVTVWQTDRQTNRQTESEHSDMEYLRAGCSAQDCQSHCARYTGGRQRQH